MSIDLPAPPGTPDANARLLAPAQGDGGVIRHPWRCLSSGGMPSLSAACDEPPSSPLREMSRFTRFMSLRVFRRSDGQHTFGYVKQPLARTG
ncbi:hypothetical protein V6U77_13935 [Micromonospora sp. CPCC 205546]|uniref:hypothetical protein n=1 Tax=Micromonospora sp. CPCC 205546 TaxID=3122397 RepID=UPI002FF41095